MAWFLAEVITDISFIKPVLSFYANKRYAAKPIQDLISLLRELPLNLDHVDNKDIPAGYNNVYHWLAEDVLHVLTRFKLLEKSSNDQCLITDKGLLTITEGISDKEILQKGLNNWENDQGIRPFIILRSVLNLAARNNRKPCKGLFLLELMLLLIRANEKVKSSSIVFDAYKATYSRRNSIFKDKRTFDDRVDTLLYTDYLLEELKGDAFNYFLANYPARSTLLLMMHSDDLVYENLPGDLLGLVQTITVSNVVYPKKRKTS